VIGVLHRPLAPRQGRQPGRARLRGRQAGDKEACVLRRLPVPFEGDGVAVVEDLRAPEKGSASGSTAATLTARVSMRPRLGSVCTKGE
jgi:hypothetical protein